MRDYTITKYKKVIDIAMQKSFKDGFITRSDFDVLAEEHKMTHTIATYLQRMNIIQRIDANKFHFVRPVTVVDIKEMGAMQMSANIRNRQKRSQNTKQMTIETSVTKVNEHQESDEFAAKMMAYLESRGFKVTKDRLDFPINTYKGSIRSLSGRPKIADEIDELDRVIIRMKKSESDHIRLAYRAGYGAGQSGRYLTADEYMKNEYNDFAS
jgi:hypothetical protein